MSEPSVVARNLGYEVGKAPLVSGVDLAASPGQLLAVLGPNGAGKSTLIQLLSGGLSPTDGNVVLDGADISGAGPSELSLIRSVLSQQSRGDIPFSVQQVVSMGRFPHRRDPTNSAAMDRAAVADAMERTDITRFARRSYATLSAGEQSRVALARVLAQDAPIVLLDEPTTALDVANQEKIMKQARRLSDEGKTVIAVLHDLNSASFYSDRILLMKQARVIATGSPREVLTAELLSDVYGQRMAVSEHPFRDCPLVLTAD